MIIALVLSTVLVLLALVHWYLWRRLVRDVSASGGRYRRVGTVLAVLLPLLSVGALVGGRLLPFSVEQWLAWPGYLWLAVLLYLTLAVLVGEAVRFGWLRIAASRAPKTASTDGTPDDPSRRLFVARTVAIGAAGAAVAVVGNGAYGVLRGPSLKRVTVPLAKLPRRAHGYRIAVVSDIHLGPILGRAHTQRIVDTINSAQPDLIAIVGDLVDGSVAELGPAAVPLAGLRAKDGAYFVTGNHEYFSGAQPWVEFVRSLGVRPLENDRIELPWFDLAGVNDIAGVAEGQGPDFVRALGDRDRARTAVLLSHQPVTIHDAVRHGVDLQLSGHTHGGQLWPGNYLAELANPTLAGLEQYGDTQLYVTRGAGAWGPPVRVGAPSDITLLTLASMQA